MGSNASAMLPRIEPSYDIISIRRHRVIASEIEELIACHEFVDKVAVFGLFELFQWSHVIYAVVSLKPGCHIRPEELLVYCRNHLNDSMVPGVIEIWNNLPQDACGKIPKKKIVSSYYSLGLFPPMA
jgi:acyl-coenzyme A synthetase/AMP-(fatty) acid ligase